MGANSSIPMLNGESLWEFRSFLPYYFYSGWYRRLLQGFKYTMPEYLLIHTPKHVVLFRMFFLPFSPRWLIAQGRDQEALQVVRMLHGYAHNEEFIKLEFAEM
jgi:hypothetical protein